MAGHAEAVARLVQAAKALKARAVPLKVSAPFHCALMAPAAERLAQALDTVAIRPPRVPVVANVDAEPNTDAGRVKDLLVRQVTGRVRWEGSVRNVLRMGVRRGVEVGHGKVLTGLARRIARELAVVPLGSPAHLDVLKEGGP